MASRLKQKADMLFHHFAVDVFAEGSRFFNHAVADGNNQHGLVNRGCVAVGRRWKRTEARMRVIRAYNAHAVFLCRHFDVVALISGNFKTQRAVAAQSIHTRRDVSDNVSANPIFFFIVANEQAATLFGKGLFGVRFNAIQICKGN
jgi:hypothetical protein